MYKDNAEFILIAIVVDDMAFASNNARLLRALQQKLQADFDVSLFGHLRSFIGWDITRTPTDIKDRSVNVHSLTSEQIRNEPSQLCAHSACFES